MHFFNNKSSSLKISSHHHGSVENDQFACEGNDRGDTPAPLVAMKTLEYESSHECFE